MSPQAHPSFLRACVICEETCVHWPVCSDRPPAPPGKDESVGTSASRLPQTLGLGQCPALGGTHLGVAMSTGHVGGGVLPVSRASEAGHAERDTWGWGCPAGGTRRRVPVVGVGKGAGHQSWGWGLLLVLSRVGRRGSREHFITTVLFRRAWCGRAKRGPYQPGSALTPALTPASWGQRVCLCAHI